MKAEQDYGRDGYMLEAMEMRRKVVSRHYTIANHDINFTQSYMYICISMVLCYSDTWFVSISDRMKYIVLIGYGDTTFKPLHII